MKRLLILLLCTSAVAGFLLLSVSLKSAKADPSCPTATRTATLTLTPTNTSTPLALIPRWLFFPLFRLDATSTPTLTPTITNTPTRPPRTRVCPGGGGCCND